ncbi:MAG TPA: alpha/beta hydrolase [Thermoanaerobaculia bacterium]|nr:alpha/beta hydrolase [Thermoanaerobaculia bacterium]
MTERALSSASPSRKNATPITLSLMRGAFGMLSRTAPEVASRLAVNLFMKPRRYARPAREKELLAEAESFVVQVGADSSVQAWRWGSGPAVLLVHGWEGRGSQLAPLVRPLLARGFSVVTFDAPAHGDSDGSRSSLPHFAWAVRRVAESISGAYAIVAHSLGCAAATLALREGLSTQRLVFFSPPLNPSDYVDRFGGILNFSTEVLDRMKLRIEERFLRKWSDYALDETARQMTTPLLVIHDRDDEETYWSEGSALAAAWPGARMLTTEGLGHRRILREAGVVEAATKFVAE